MNPILENGAGGIRSPGMYVLYIPSDPPAPSDGGFLPPFPPLRRRRAHKAHFISPYLVESLTHFELLKLETRKVSKDGSLKYHRSRGDSNPRNLRRLNGFQDRLLQPLGHRSRKVLNNNVNKEGLSRPLHPDPVSWNNIQIVVKMLF